MEYRYKWKDTAPYKLVMQGDGNLVIYGKIKLYGRPVQVERVQRLIS